VGRHRAEKLVVGKPKGGQARSVYRMEQTVGSRTFNYLSFEGKVERDLERERPYATCGRSKGDDNMTRNFITSTSSPLRKFAQVATMGTPSIRTLLTHLVRFDHPDWCYAEEFISEVARAWCCTVEREGCSQRREFTRIDVRACTEDVLPSFPGLDYRRSGLKTKADAEVIALGEARIALEAISRGERVLPKPCAMFGRGKRLMEDREAGFVGDVRAGRLVLAANLRDHIMVEPLARFVYDAVKLNWRSTEMALGTSFFNRGSTTFLYNLVADMCPGRYRRVNFHVEQRTVVADAMEQAINWFEKEAEKEWAFYVMDIKRQDASLVSAAIDDFFTWVKSLMAYGGTRSRRRVERYIAWVREFALRTRIALPDGRILIKWLGNISGWPLTTLLNTFTSARKARIVLETLLGNDAARESVVRVYGDNIILAIRRENEPEEGLLPEIKECWEMVDGQVLSDEESYRCTRLRSPIGSGPRESVEFLKRRFWRGGVVWRLGRDLVGSLVAPDGDVGGDETRYARACSLLIEGCFDPEVVSMLEGYLDMLEKRGVTEGAFGRRERNVLRYKMGPEFASETVQRLPAWYCQTLYTMTSSERTQTGFAADCRYERTAYPFLGMLKEFGKVAYLNRVAR